MDFSSVPRQQVGDRAFHTRWPGLSDVVRRGVAGGAVQPGTRDRWLGGTSQVDRTALEREFPPPDNNASDDGSGRDLRDLARTLAPYLVAALVLAGLALVLGAVVRGRRTTRGGTNR